MKLRSNNIITASSATFPSNTQRMDSIHGSLIGTHPDTSETTSTRLETSETETETTSSEESSEEDSKPRRYPRRGKKRSMEKETSTRKRQKRFCSRTDLRKKPEVIEVLFEQSSTTSKFDQCSHGNLSDYTCSDCCYLRWREALAVIRHQEQGKDKNKISEHATTNASGVSQFKVSDFKKSFSSVNIPPGINITRLPHNKSNTKNDSAKPIQKKM